MRTPAKYNTLIKNGKITSQILGEVLYSINKRAKNWRDKKKEYKSLRYDRYDNYEKALEAGTKLLQNEGEYSKETRTYSNT